MRSRPQPLGIVLELAETHVAGTTQPASNLASRVVVVDVLDRSLSADGTQSVLRSKQCVPFFDGQPERATQMDRLALNPSAVLAIGRIAIPRAGVPMPARNRGDDLAAGTILLAGRCNNPSTDRATFCRLSYAMSLGLTLPALWLQAIRTTAMTGEIADGANLSATATALHGIKL